MRSLINFKFIQIVGVFAVMAGIVGYFGSDWKREKISRGYDAILCADSLRADIPVIRKVINKEELKSYLKYSKGESKQIVFTGRWLPKNTVVKVIDTMENHSDFYRIYIHRENPTSQNPRNEYLWVWKEFLCEVE